MTTETFFANFGHLADAPNGVKKLRELILQLAVQGKLVPQDPQDEPASVLLESNRNEKSRLVKEKKIRAVKENPKHSMGDLEHSLPCTWDFDFLGSIAHVITKGATPTTYGYQFQNEGIAFVKVENVKGGHIVKNNISTFISEEAHESQVRSQLKVGDILFSIAGTIGETCIVKESDLPANTNQALAIIRGTMSVFDAAYLKMQLDSFVANAVKIKARGGAMNNVSLGDLRDLLVFVPPLEEQKRIVTKVDQLMTLCDELETRQKKQQQGRVRLNNAALDKLLTARKPDEFADHWQRISTNFDLLYDHPETIAKLRGAILQLAVQGKLVPQDTNDEPASVLLERVRAEKGKLISNKKVRGNKDVASVDNDDEIIQVAAGWQRARIGEFSLVQGGKRLPKGSAFSSVPTAQIYIQVTNMKNGSIVTENLKYIDVETFAQINKYIIEKDDLYITIAGTIGDVGEVPETFHRMSLTENAAKFVFRGLDKRFFLLALRSEQSQIQFREKTKQLAQPKLALHRIADAVVPIPPLEEQKRIVAKVDQLMALCNQLETKLNQAQQRSEKLMEATVQHLLVA